jgi:hypothetical protein
MRREVTRRGWRALFPDPNDMMIGTVRIEVVVV